MECPSCKIQLLIRKSFTNTHDGKVFTVQELHCINPQCPLRSDSIPVAIVEHEHPAIRQSYSLHGCTNCGVNLLRTEGDGYEAIGECEEKDGEVVIVCPNCGTNNQYRVSP